LCLFGVAIRRSKNDAWNDLVIERSRVQC